MLKFILVTFLLISAAEAKDFCSRAFEYNDEDAARAAFTHLPSVNSGIARKLIREIQIQAQKNHTYASLDLSQIITDRMAAMWRDSQPRGESWSIVSKTVRLEHGRDRVLPDWQAAGSKSLALWLSAIIKRAIGEQDIGKPRIEFRAHNPKGEGRSVHKWHVDGGYVSVILSLYGPGVEILGPAPKLPNIDAYVRVKSESWLELCSHCTSHVMPARRAVIIFGNKFGNSDMYRPTVHRSPDHHGERGLFVFRYGE